MEPGKLAGVSVLITKGLINWVIHRRSGHAGTTATGGTALRQEPASAAGDELVLLLATLIGGGMNNE